MKSCRSITDRHKKASLGALCATSAALAHEKPTSIRAPTVTAFYFRGMQMAAYCCRFGMPGPSLSQGERKQKRKEETDWFRDEQLAIIQNIVTAINTLGSH